MALLLVWCIVVGALAESYELLLRWPRNAKFLSCEFNYRDRR